MCPSPDSESRRRGPLFHAEDNLDGERRAVRPSEPPAEPKASGFGRKLRDTDLGERVVRLEAGVAAIPGFLIGAVLGLFLWEQEMAPAWVALLCPFLFAGALPAVAYAVTSKAGVAASKLYTPEGRAPSKKREYSYAESLVARGMYAEAVDAFEMAVAEDPADITPYLRIARIYRDHLTRFEDAARWFRRALREARVTEGMATLARKELVELYVHRLGEPAKAAPELARMAEEFAGRAEGEWAAAELAEVKRRIAEERDV